MKTRSKILFGLLLLFIAVLGFIFLLPHGGYRRQLEAYKQQLIARGEKLTMAELAPKPSDDATNGAKAFMDLMNGYTSPTNFPTPMKIVAPGLAESTSTNLPPYEMVGYEQNLGKVAELRKILNAASVFDFDVDYTDGGFPLPHLVKLKVAQQLIRATTIQAFSTNNFSEGRSDLMAAADLFRLFNNEPIIISGLVRANLVRMATGATWEGLQREEWTDPELLELQNKWDGINLFTNATTAIAIEKSSEIAWMAEIREKRALWGIDFVGNLSGHLGSAEDDGAFGHLEQHLNKLTGRARFWRWKTSWSYDEELCLLQLGEAASDLARNADATGAFVPATALFNQQLSNVNRAYLDGEGHFLILGSVTGATFSSYGDDLLRLAGTETIRRMTVTAIALKRYHLQHGTYPVTLDHLVPAFLPAVPVDFMDGKPLRYKLRSDGDFLLYSVGQDGVDDGGDPTVSSAETLDRGGALLAGRDIVWPRVATPAALEEFRQHSQTPTNAPGNQSN